MFGDRFFSSRQRLIDIIVGVRSLGEECGTDVSALADEGEFLKELNRPFLFMACGEVNAGKSTLLNGLFGEEICQSDALPNTKKIEYIRSNQSDETEKIHSTLFVEKQAPFALLNQFHLIDTPGTNLLNDEHHEIIEGFLPSVDLLFIVFAANNPWCADTWQLVSKLPEDTLKNSAFVLQQCDLKHPEDIEVILGHMQNLAQQKIGFSPRFFPVSGKMALEVKGIQPPPIHLLNKSGLPSLESFISSLLGKKMDRQEVMQLVHDSTLKTLDRIEKQIESRRYSLNDDQRFLAELENEVDLRREQQANQLAIKLSGLGDVFLQQAAKSWDLLSRRLSVFQSLISLFQRERLPTQIERGLSEAVQEAIKERSGIDGANLATNCRDHWETVAPRIAENLAVSVPDFDKETESLKGTRERFVQRLGRSAKQAVAQLKIRNILELQMERRRTVLRRLMNVILILLSAAGITGGLELATWPFALLGVAAGVTLLAITYSTFSRQRICEEFQEQIKDLQQVFSESLEDDYRDGVHEFYIEYGGLFAIVRRRIASQRHLLKPRLKRWNDLFLELKAVGQEI